MSERREPTISTLGASEEDALDASSCRARAVDPQRRSPPVSSRPVVVKSSNGLAWFCFLLSLLALGGVGFLFFQLQQTQKAQQTELAQALDRVATLEGRLSLADDESTQSMAVLQTKVKENASEVRKLWGVSYDTNRKAIEESKKAIEKLEKTVSGSEKSWRAADEALKKTLDGFKNEVNAISELMDTQQAVIKKLNQQGDSKEALKALEDKLSTVQAQVEKRLKTNEEAIEAIDAFRIQVNRDLLQLKGG